MVKTVKSNDSCNKKSQEIYNGLYIAPIDKFGRYGRDLRHMFLCWILAGTNIIVHFQKWRTPWLDRVMHCLSFLGTEDFYTPVIVILAWIINTRQAVLFTILMGVGFYIATALKNVIRLPRPPSPPVQVLETTFDWSFPSLHAIIGVVLPGYICVYSLQHYNLSTCESLCLVLVILLWSLSVNISRMYLGVHSPADLLFGSTLGFLLLIMYTAVDDAIYHWICHAQAVLVPVLITYAVFLLLHPSSEPPTHSYGETVVTNGVAYGCMLAMRHVLSSEQPGQYEALLEHAQVRPWLMSFLAISIARIVIGFPLILLTRIVCKTMMRAVMFCSCDLLGVNAYSYSDYKKGMVQLNKHYRDTFLIPAQINQKLYNHLAQSKKGDEANGELHQHEVVHNGTTNHQHNGTTAATQQQTPTENGTTHTTTPSSTTLPHKEEQEQHVIHRNGARLITPSLPPPPPQQPDMQVEMRTTGTMYPSMPLDIDTPTKFVTYATMSYIAASHMHHLFHLLGLDL